MNIYDTAVLQALVRSLKRPSSFLLDVFFPMVATSESEEIYFDVENGKRRISPFVSPLVQGKLVESLGYQTKNFRPAYVKDKRVIDPNKPLRRMMGESIAGSMSAANREQAHVANELQDQSQMLTRRQEVMASEAMRDGQVTVTGDGYDTVVVDFGRDSNLEVVLTAGNRWGETGIEPLDDLEDWALLVQQTEGAIVTDIVLDPKAYALLRESAKVKDALDVRRTPDEDRLAAIAGTNVTGQLKGRIGNWRIWTYQEWYVDESGTEQKMMPDHTVLLGATEQVQGTRHYGAIRDAELGYRAEEQAVKSWVEKDPAVRYLLLQSAPLVVPYRPNATFRATVR